jgi:hypothetical protein
MDHQTETLLEKTKDILIQVETLQNAMEKLRLELNLYGRALRSKLAEEEAAPTMQSGAAANAPVEGRPPVEPPTEKIRKLPERRSAFRRRTSPVPVQLSYSRSGAAPFPGWVVDCSSEGVGLMLDQVVAVGATLSCRPTNAPQRFRWVQIEVRNARLVKNRWNIGCRFVRPLPPEDVELFR